MITLNCPLTCQFVQRCEKNPVMPDGTPGGILFVGEAPGFQEVEAGHGFAGQAGKNLFMALEEIGYTKHSRSVVIKKATFNGKLGYVEIPFTRANAVLCHPTKDGKNRKPTKDEITACRGNLDAAIEYYQPKVIVTVGKTAADALGVMLRWDNPSFLKVLFKIAEHEVIEGYHIKGKCYPVIPMPHTSGLSWNRTTNGVKHSDLGKQLLKIAVELAK